MTRRHRKFSRIERLESRRLLAASLGEAFDTGAAPYAQQAVHLSQSAHLGTPPGSAVSPVDGKLFDQLFEPPKESGPFSLGDSPRKTRAADVNGAGRIDLVTLSDTHLTVRLLPEQGGYSDRIHSSFEDLGLRGCRENFLLSDVNGDGKSEAIVFCSSGGLAVLGANESGVFDTVMQSDENVGIDFDYAATADINGDGHLDHIVMTLQGLDETVILLGSESGELTVTGLSQTADPNVVALLVEDIDDDTHQDIVVALSDPVYDGALWWMQGNGDGTFEDLSPLFNFDSGRSFLSLDAEDMNNDGRTDLVVSHYEQEIEIWYREELGYREQVISMPDFVLGVQAEKVPGDTLASLYVSTQNLTGTPSYSTRFYHYEQPGFGFFESTGSQLLRPFADDFELVDLFGDGTKDVLISDELITVIPTEDDGSLDFFFSLPSSESPTPRALVHADFNEDGYEDVAFFHRNNDHFTLAFGSVDAAWKPEIPIVRISLPRVYSVTQAVADDVNGDGHMDIVGLGNEQTDTNILLLGNGDGTFQTPIIDPGRSFELPVRMAVGDVNDDGMADAVFVRQPQDPSGNSSLEVEFGDPTEPWGSPGLDFLPGDVQAVHEEIIDGKMYVLRADGTFVENTFQPNGFLDDETELWTASLPQEVREFTAADLNGDDRMDFVVTYGFSSPSEIYRSNASGAYDRIVDPLGGIHQSVYAVDVTGDGLDEIFFDGRGWSFLFDAGGTLTAEELPSERSLQMFEAADLNGDGARDLVYVAGGLQVAWGRPTDRGSSLAKSSYIAAGQTNQLTVDVQLTEDVQYVSLWVDWNQDGNWSADEAVIRDREVDSPGRHRFAYDAPAVVAGHTWARLRMTDVPGVAADGVTLGGEVEDYPVTILDDVVFDYGDAPTAAMASPLEGHLWDYPVTAAQDGARHAYDPDGPRFSTIINAESDGVPSLGANGEEQVDTDTRINGFLAVGEDSFLRLGSRADGYVSVWLDINRDGDWDDPGEQLVSGLHIEVAPGISVTTRIVRVDVPESLAGQSTYLRARISTEPDLAPTGIAPDGEVVDLFVSIGGPTPAPAPKIVIGSQQPELSTFDSESPAVFAVHLSSMPTKPLSVLINVADPGEVNASTTQLIFDQNNWSKPQAVEISAASVAVLNGDPITEVMVELRDGFATIDTVTLEVQTADVPTLPALNSRLDLDENETMLAGEDWSVGELQFDGTSWVRQVVRDDDSILVGGPSLWQNPLERFDINLTGDVSPRDALLVINELDRRSGDGNFDLGIPSAAERLNFLYYDSTGDSVLSPLDALRVINFLARNAGGGAEGEAVASDFLVSEDESEEERAYDAAIASLF